jgi:AraC family transcriptional regulator of adaptative response/methylated-DNA-[protein]-cysteine methyltransferase
MASEHAVQDDPASAGAGLSRRQVALVKKACAHIDARDGQEITLASLAAHVGASPWHLQRLFKKVLGVSPREYADARRSRRFRAELKNGESIAGATYGAGYGSSSRVYERAEAHLGMTPASYAKGGRRARIAYSIVESPLGRLLVAATAKGICFVSLGDGDATLEAALQAEFPQAEAIIRDEQAIAPALKALLDYIAGETPHIDLPLDVRATAFQRRVWQELMTIPAGETRSYSDIAEAIGLPRGQRAVGRACATNPVSIVIPCHRALRQDGALGGYRWGLKRKEALLRGEAKRGDA